MWMCSSWPCLTPVCHTVTSANYHSCLYLKIGATHGPISAFVRGCLVPSFFPWIVTRRVNDLQVTLWHLCWISLVLYQSWRLVAYFWQGKSVLCKFKKFGRISLIHQLDFESFGPPEFNKWFLPGQWWAALDTQAALCWLMGSCFHMFSELLSYILWEILFGQGLSKCT